MMYFLFILIVSLVVFVLVLLFKKVFKPFLSGLNSRTAIIIFFFGLLFTCFIGGFFSKQKISQAENRNLAKWKPIKKTGIINAPGQIDEYVNDHFGFRGEYLKFFNFIQYKIFKRALTNRIIIGKDGWFFSQRSIQYTYLNESWDEEYFKQSGFIDRIEKLNCKLKERNIKLYILILPSKDYIYDEYLPKWISSNKEKRQTINSFVNAIENNTDIELLDLYSFMRTAKDSCKYNLYFKSDTHWNKNGAYFAAKEIFRFLNITNETLIHDNLDSYLLKSYKMQGDLYRSGNISDIETGIGYTSGISFIHNEINLSKDSRKALRLSDQISDWKKIKICYSNIFTKEKQKMIPIIIGDSYMLSSSGNIVKNMFSKCYTMHYEEIGQGLTPVINEAKDANILILSFVDYKFNDERSNSFYNNFMRWDQNGCFNNVKVEWEKELPY